MGTTTRLGQVPRLWISLACETAMTTSMDYWLPVSFNPSQKITYKILDESHP